MEKGNCYSIDKQKIEVSKNITSNSSHSIYFSLLVTSKHDIIFEELRCLLTNSAGCNIHVKIFQLF